jgi:hypothetical protein
VEIRPPFARFPSAVGTVGKAFWFLDFSTVSTARHFHRALQRVREKVKGSRTKQVRRCLYSCDTGRLDLKCETNCILWSFDLLNLPFPPFFSKDVYQYELGFEDAFIFESVSVPWLFFNFKINVFEIRNRLSGLD